MARCYYQNSIPGFLQESEASILGKLSKANEFDSIKQQTYAWEQEIQLLKKQLDSIDGDILFEFTIPRMGHRVDCVVLHMGIVFVIEFKVDSPCFDAAAKDQVMDYAVDLKNFHEASHTRKIIPILVATAASHYTNTLQFKSDQVAEVQCSSGFDLGSMMLAATQNSAEPPLDCDQWVSSIYKPTPTIIQAAQALYRGHSIKEISRSDAGAKNLTQTADAIHQIIQAAKANNHKSICFLTGVPGAGKTLAGLNLANSWHNVKDEEYAVFLSGNGPLVKVLCEALARSEVQNAKLKGKKKKKVEAERQAKTFIQNIHHFRDDGLESNQSPKERVVVFDEAQRAWTLEKTKSFMKTKKGKAQFSQSESEFLISYMDRHTDWCVIICLIGGGQEINTGEAGLAEWFESIRRSFPQWNVHISDRITDSEYTQGKNLLALIDPSRLHSNQDLHLSVSIRSFRSEKVSALVKSILDYDINSAKAYYQAVSKNYSIMVTRNPELAKEWLREQARGSERYGFVACSGALRLKPLGYNVKSPIDPKNWFLNPKDDVRSSYYLEDVATEFDVQGLELDWVGLIWDANLRITNDKWKLKCFSGSTWHNVKDADARLYLKNAYRVLMTRARQGMVIVIPEGDSNDPTRLPEFYDGVYSLFLDIGLTELN